MAVLHLFLIIHTAQTITTPIIPQPLLSIPKVFISSAPRLIKALFAFKAINSEMLLRYLAGILLIWLLDSGKPTSASPNWPEGHPPKDLSGAEADFVATLSSSEAGQSEVFAQALSLLTSLESSPSCNRLATSTLINSCQTLDGPLEGTAQESENPEAFLDNVKSIYAVRLAVCELAEAGASVPVPCSPMMPKKPARKHHGFKGYLSRNGQSKNGNGKTVGHDDVSSVQLSHCLKSLESRPQWWTSYSNGRQNAIVICKAVRIDIEKDDLLSLHKSMAGVTSNLSSTLLGVLHESRTWLADQRAFSEATQKFQAQVLRDLEGASSKAQGLFIRIKQDMDSMIQAVTSMVQKAGKSAEASIDTVDQKIRASGKEAMVLREVLQETTQVLRSELVVIQAAHRELVQDMENSLEQLRGNQIEELSKAFQDRQARQTRPIIRLLLTGL
ncbi:MAG: hypothetical protein M1839_005741 [Geoglossum umbratile]|nr:MAG: hypothetical protein M1839_005741 [Geoglossum umbratile]